MRTESVENKHVENKECWGQSILRTKIKEKKVLR